MKNWFKFAIHLVVAVCFSSVLADSYTDFFQAVNVDNGSSVADLLARGFDPNAPDEKGQVALYLAMRDDSPKVAAALLASRDLRIDAENGVGETALMMAALKGRADWVQRLLARGAAVNKEGWSPLLYAASGPEASIVKLLLERGARVDAPSPNGTTALMMAARYGGEAAVDILLAAGADPKLRNQRGLSVVDFARQGGRVRLAERLGPLAP